MNNGRTWTFPYYREKRNYQLSTINPDDYLTWITTNEIECVIAR
jgi:hypothetical protein